MFASTNTVRSTDIFAVMASVNLSRQGLFYDVNGFEDAMMDDISAGLLERFGGDDGLDYFVDQKSDRRAAYHCRGNRFGGDVGNKKRREGERYDSDREHAERVALERKATRRQIEDGLAEYYSGEFRYYDLPRGHNKRRGKRGGTNRGGASRMLGGFGPRQSDDRPQDGSTCVQQQRFGRQVVVTVLKKGATRLERKAALASIAGSLPKLETAGIKAKMGLN